MSADRLADTLASSLFTLSRLMREQLMDQIKKNHPNAEKKKGSPAKAGTGDDSLSFLHVKTMSIICERDNPSMKDVADCLHITSPSTTAIIDKLVKQHLLERFPDPGDRRIIRLRLTKTGKEKTKMGMKDAMKDLRPLLEALDSEEQKQMLALIDKIISRNESKEGGKSSGKSESKK